MSVIIALLAGSHTHMPHWNARLTETLYSPWKLRCYSLQTTVCAKYIMKRVQTETKLRVSIGQKRRFQQTAFSRFHSIEIEVRFEMCLPTLNGTHSLNRSRIMSSLCGIAFFLSAMERFLRKHETHSKMHISWLALSKHAKALLRMMA